jgi:membrane fusion protein, heavy metal efflux system
MKIPIKIFLLSTLLLACSKKQETTETPAEKEVEIKENEVELSPEQFKTADIRYGNLEMKSLSGAIQVSGVLDVPPQNLVSISAPTSGYIKSTDLLQGKYVKKGAIIATLSNPDLLTIQQDLVESRGQLQETKGQMEFLEADLERQKELASENANAKKALQKAQSDFNATKGKISSLEGRIGAISAKLKAIGIDPNAINNSNFVSVISVFSPISGYVTQVSTNIGAFVNPQDVLFKIVDTGHLHAELTVFEKDISKLKIGQKFRFHLANESTERTATIHLIGKEISQDRTIRVHGHLDREDHQLIPGMYLKAAIETGSNMVSALSDKAIVDFEGNKYIFIAENEAKRQFKMISVKIGISELGYSEIILDEKNDLKNAKIVVNGAYDLLSKMKNSEEEE